MHVKSAGVENVIRKQETEKLVMIMDKLNCSIHFGMNSQLEKYGNQSRFQPYKASSNHQQASGLVFIFEMRIRSTCMFIPSVTLKFPY